MVCRSNFYLDLFFDTSSCFFSRALETASNKKKKKPNKWSLRPSSPQWWKFSFTLAANAYVTSNYQSSLDGCSFSHDHSSPALVCRLSPRHKFSEIHAFPSEHRTLHMPPLTIVNYLSWNERIDEEETFRKPLNCSNSSGQFQFGWIVNIGGISVEITWIAIYKRRGLTKLLNWNLSANYLCVRGSVSGYIIGLLGILGLGVSRISQVARSPP